MWSMSETLLKRYLGLAGNLYYTRFSTSLVLVDIHELQKVAIDHVSRRLLGKGK